MLVGKQSGIDNAGDHWLKLYDSELNPLGIKVEDLKPKALSMNWKGEIVIWFDEPYLLRLIGPFLLVPVQIARLDGWRTLTDRAKEAFKNISAALKFRRKARVRVRNMNRFLAHSRGTASIPVLAAGCLPTLGFLGILGKNNQQGVFTASLLSPPVLAAILAVVGVTYLCRRLNLGQKLRSVRKKIVIKPVLFALCLLPVALFLNHIICEYALGPDASLHYLSNGRIIGHFLVSLIVFSGLSYVLFCHFTGKKVSGSTILGALTFIYGGGLQTFDIIKYHGVWNYISIGPYLLSPGDVFIFSAIIYLVIKVPKKKHENTLSDREKTDGKSSKAYPKNKRR